MLRLARILGPAVVLSVLAASGAAAATLDPIGSFDQPIFITSDRVEADRLFVVERPGRVAEVPGEGAAPRLYADLTGFVSCCASERGLLSIALSPGFRTSGRFYAAYTGTPAAGGAEGDIHVDAFVADGAGRVTRTPVISIPHNLQANHNGGQIQLGPDGYLYISTGDGGGGGDPFETGQSLSSLLGKILRIDPHPGSSPAYSIPPGNPFGGSAGADEIWAYGLRNPWRFSFDSLSGDMLIADVGQGAREEVDLARSPTAGVVGGAGANYGWSCREGLIAYNDSTPTANCAGVSGFTDPIFDYPHTDPGGGKAHGCSITGGYVVRDESLGDLYGRYLYADYCAGEIRSLSLPAGTEPAIDRSEGIAAANPVSFGEDACHRLYLASGATVYRLVGAAPAICREGPAEEEPPGGEGPPEAPGPSPPGSSAPDRAGAPAALPALAEARLFGRRRGGRLVLTVRVAPCSGLEGAAVGLRRGARPSAFAHLDASCSAVFRTGAPRPGTRATFRALVQLPSGRLLRSNRFSQRSQVRTIALANPIP